MKQSRIFLPINSEDLLPDYLIETDKAHYIKNVLRLKTKDKIKIFTSDKVEFLCQITAINRHTVQVNCLKKLSPIPDSKLELTIVQGISSSDRMDYTVQKSAELGVKQFIPIWTEYCSTRIPQNKYAKKQQHWQNIAISASEQSGRCDILKVHPICHLNDVSQHCSYGIYLEPSCQNKLSEFQLDTKKNLSIFIGPEGGFSSTEITSFQKKGQFKGIKIGYRILRTETVAPVIVSALHSLFGDFI